MTDRHLIAYLILLAMLACIGIVYAALTLRSRDRNRERRGRPIEKRSGWWWWWS